MQDLLQKKDVNKKTNVTQELFIINQKVNISIEVL